jgi:hypothetical protein
MAIPKHRAGGTVAASGRLKAYILTYTSINALISRTSIVYIAAALASSTANSLHHCLSTITSLTLHHEAHHPHHSRRMRCRDARPNRGGRRNLNPSRPTSRNSRHARQTRQMLVQRPPDRGPGHLRQLRTLLQPLQLAGKGQWRMVLAVL